MLKNYFLFFLLLLFQQHAKAQKVYFFHDTLNKIKIKDISEGNIHWQEVDRGTLNVGFVKEDVVWLKITNTNKNELLTIPNAALDSVTFYSESKIINCGDRVYNPRYDEPIPVLPCGDSVIFLRIKKDYSSLVIPLSFKNKITFSKNHTRFKLLDILFLGVFVAFLIFALALFVYSRWRVFLFFSFYVVTTILFYYTTNGLLKSVFFPKFLFFSELRLYVSCIAPLTLFWFNRSLISYETRFLNLFTRFISYGILILVICSLFFYDFIKNNIVKEYVFSIYLLCLLLVFELLYMNIRELFMPKQTSQKRYAYLFLGSIIITIILFVLESLKLKWLPDFDLFLVITCIEVIVFGMFISIDFVGKYKENEQKALQLFNAKKSALNELKVIQFKERKKIATILHNRYQSQLTGFRLYLGNILSSDQQILQDMKLFEEEIRDFSHQILPKELENGLFHDAIIRQLNFFRKIYPTWKITYQTYDMASEIKQDWIYDLYLILSELLQNSFKHSDGNTIHIEFYDHSEDYLLTYSDNGNPPNKKDFEEGFGISLIRDQIENIGSEFNFELNPNLFIIIRIPK